MSFLLLPRLLVLVAGEPTADAQGLSFLLVCLSIRYPHTGRQIFVPLYERLTKAFHDWDGDEDMVTPAQVALMFVDWTDPIRAACVVFRNCGLACPLIMFCIAGMQRRGCGRTARRTRSTSTSRRTSSRRCSASTTTVSSEHSLVSQSSRSLLTRHVWM